MKLSDIFLDMLRNQKDYDLILMDSEKSIYEYGYKKNSKYKSLSDENSVFQIMNNSDGSFSFIENTSKTNSNFIIYSKSDKIGEFLIKVMDKIDSDKSLINVLKNVQFISGSEKITPFKNWKNLLEQLGINTTYSASLEYNDFFRTKNSEQALKKYYLNNINEEIPAKIIRELLNFFVEKKEAEMVNNLFENNTDNIKLESYESIEYVLKNTEYFDSFTNIVKKRNENFNNLFEEKNIKIITLNLSYPFLLKKYPISSNNSTNSASVSDYETVMSQVSILMKENKKHLNFKRLNMINRVASDNDFMFNIEDNGGFKKEIFIKLFEKYLEVFVTELNNQVQNVNKNIQQSIYATKVFMTENAKSKLKNYFELVLQYENETNVKKSVKRNNKI